MPKTPKASTKTASPPQPPLPPAAAAPLAVEKKRSLLDLVADTVDALHEQTWKIEEDLKRAQWQVTFAQGAVEHHDQKVQRALDPDVIGDEAKRKAIVEETYENALIRRAIEKSPGGWGAMQKAGATDEQLLAKLKAWPEGTYSQKGPVFFKRGYVGYGEKDQVKALHVYLSADENCSRIPPQREYKGAEVLALVRKLIGIPKPVAATKPAAKLTNVRFIRDKSKDPAKALDKSLGFEAWLGKLASAMGIKKDILREMEEVDNCFAGNDTIEAAKKYLKTKLAAAKPAATTSPKAAAAKPAAKATVTLPVLPLVKRWEVGDRAWVEGFGWGEVRTGDSADMGFLPDSAKKTGQNELVGRNALKRAEPANPTAPPPPAPIRTPKKPAGPDVSDCFSLEEKGLGEENVWTLRAAASDDRLARGEPVKRIVLGDGVSYIVTGMSLGEAFGRFDLRPCMPQSLWNHPTRTYEAALKKRGEGEYVDLAGVVVRDAAAALFVISGGPVFVKAPVTPAGE